MRVKHIRKHYVEDLQFCIPWQSDGLQPHHEGEWGKIKVKIAQSA
jgi:hypothetical protein